MMKQWVSILCVFALLLPLCGCEQKNRPDSMVNSVVTAPTGSMAPSGDGTVPVTTVPATTAPVQTVPPTTAPVQTVPPTTAPVQTVPPTTVPAQTVPPTTAPAPTVPPTTVPKPTTPVACSHDYSVSSTVAATCTTKGSATYSCSKCGHSYVQELELASHTVVIDPAVAATCTNTGKTEGKHCSVCKTVLIPQSMVGKTAHKEVIIPGVTPTETTSGMTAGKKCSTCSRILVQQTVIPAYLDSCNGRFAYEQLKTQENGTAKQKLYERLDAAVRTFHTGNANAQNGIAVSVDFTDLGLSEEDVLQVWLSYRNDNPLYYWISGTVNFENSKCNIAVDETYVSGATRQNYNQLVYEKITDFVNKASGETSSYMIALAYHDAIIEAIDYAYEDDGYTPEDAMWAHNILGVFEKGSGVCEAYARTFQLLLNVSGVENTFVSGTAGIDSLENHAWNLVKLDDGQWYWCDLTWDDNPGWEWGIVYNYFCVNDTQNVNWTDSWDAPPEHGFMADHTPCVAMNSELTWQIDLPARAKSPYSGSGELLVRDTFTVDELTYSVIGFHTVQLIKVERDGALVIPEEVEYKGVRYTVISIGRVREDGLFDQFTVLENTTSVTIPKTVQFIWDFSLDCPTLEWFKVDSQNPYFTSVDGVLFTKSLYTLIAYPSGAPKTARYVIPDATVWVANGAFTSINNPIYELVIGANVEGFGLANWGKGYLNAQPTGMSIINVVGGDPAEMINRWNWNGWDLKFTVAEGNEYYKVIDGVLYLYYDGAPAVVEAAASTDVSAVSIADGVTRIGMYAFSNCKNLTSVTLPNSIREIGDVAFDCPNLEEITFLGTVNEWNAVTKAELWKLFKDLTVVCTDGRVT